MIGRPVKNEMYISNKEILGDFNKSLSAKCENGIFVGYMDENVLTFKGIPFACPPVGKLRWKLPQSVKPSNKVFEAYHSCKTSIQPKTTLDAGLAYEMGEDCLGLNIYNNVSNKSKKKAVMVWIHGGEFLSGGNSSGLYDGFNFVNTNDDIILVVINYRLGIMGFVDFSKIEGGENYPDINLGIYDQIEALRWIKKNIASFGGDPDCITIFGESAGGGSVSTLCVVNAAKGLFKRAIIQSGSVSQAISNKNTYIPAVNLAKAFNAKNMDDLLAIPEDKLKEYWQVGSVDARNYIVRDNRLFSKNPFNLWDEGETSDLDILQGFNTDEWRMFVGSFKPKEFYDALNKEIPHQLCANANDKCKCLFDEYMALIKDTENPKWPGTEFMNEYYFHHGMHHQASSHYKNNGRGYAYIFNVPSAIPGMGACHITDVGYVFGNLDGKISKNNLEDWELSKKIQKMWTNFAKTGNPSTKEINWPAYDLKSRNTLVIDYDIKVVSDPNKERRELFEKMTKENFDLNYGITFPEMEKITRDHNPQFKE